MSELLVILCILEVFYAYFGYPLVLCFVIGIREYFSTRLEVGSTEKSNLSAAIIITVHNEREVIEEKLRNTLSLEWKEGHVCDGDVEIIVASDASDDGTDEIVKESSNKGVRLVRVPKRQGKEFAQAQALKETKADIVLFTDAKTTLDSAALSNAVRYFRDENIGAVSSYDTVCQEPGVSGESLYVRYEMWLRSLESKLYSVVGLSGSAFVVRREVAEELKRDIPSDFALLMACVKKGYIGILAKDVVCKYNTTKSNIGEFNRKVRTVLRGLTTFFACSEMLNVRRHGIFSLQLISHKLCRWLVPWALIGCVTFSLVGYKYSSFLRGLVLFEAIFIFLAIGAVIHPKLKDKKICKIPLFFVLTNFAILVAWLKYLSGVRHAYWRPSNR